MTDEKGPVWTFADGRKLVFGSSDGSEYRGSPIPYILMPNGETTEAAPLRVPACVVCGAMGDLQRSPVGWQCERCLLSEDLVETPVYEALGYPETDVYETDLDGVARVVRYFAGSIDCLAYEHMGKRKRVDDKTEDK